MASNVVVMGGRLHSRRLYRAMALVSILVVLPRTLLCQSPSAFVDPFIGSKGKGNVFVGPACPFGMAKPGPDCDLGANSGYVADSAKTVFGFSQTHVSGTGGGPKYGNISLFPFMGDFASIYQESLRSDEHARSGYYGVTLTKWDIRVEMTASHRSAMHRYIFKKAGTHGVKIDAGSFLGEEPVPDAREAQQFVGSEVQILSDSSVAGYSRIRGGWNNGAAYTVYFYALVSRPFTRYGTWKGAAMHPNVPTQIDSGEKTGAFLLFDGPHTDTLLVKIGLSYISELKARDNMERELDGSDFDDVVARARAEWDAALGRIEIDGTADQKKMFYTALYHVMLMPVDKTGENPRWISPMPYYDDFYTLWDTFRSSAPLLTLLDPARQIDIVNAMLNIYQHDGYLPEGRSGDCNGRTQGGSNGEVVIADAYAKGLPGINYRLALEAMLKDALIPPGGNEEKEGRGGLADYNRLGYVSSAYVRAGTRTVEYAYDDFCLAQVAKGIGREGEYERFMKQSSNWQHLWRDVEDHGARGFIMPRDASGAWLDSVQCDISNGRRTFIRYTPLTTEWPICICWWCGFFYEGVSWEYSFFVPQDIPALIEKCGGATAFESRLDTFFDSGFYDVTNEPDFLTSSLYHWIGRPDRSSQRTRTIVSKNFSSARDGIPGNDDSGAMSSWLAFHMMGLYPNAGQPYYLLTAPIVRKTTIHLAGGSQFEIVARNLSDKNVYVQSAMLDGRPFDQAWIEHRDITRGGTLVLEMGDRPSMWGRATPPPLYK